MPSTVLKDSSANVARNNSNISKNRFGILRDFSQEDTRLCSPSVKRKANNNLYANAAKKSFMSRNNGAGRTGIVISPPTPVQAISTENLEIIEVNSAKIASICEKLHNSILAIQEENPVCPILRNFCSIFHIQSENSKLIVDALRKIVYLAPTETGTERTVAGSASGLSDSEMDIDPKPVSQMVSLGRVPRSRNSLLPSDTRGRQPRKWDPAGG